MKAVATLETADRNPQSVQKPAGAAHHQLCEYGGRQMIIGDTEFSSRHPLVQAVLRQEYDCPGAFGIR